MFLGKKKPPAVMRKVSAPVKPKQDEHQPRTLQHRTLTSTGRNIKASDLLKKPTASRSANNRSPRPAHRRIDSPAHSSSRSSSAVAGAERSSRPPTKRKALSPSVLFSSSSESESDGESLEERMRSKRSKRSRSTQPGSVEPDLKRTVYRFMDDVGNSVERFPIIHNEVIVSGAFAKEYKPAEGFAPSDAAEGLRVMLQYPSRYPAEPFRLVKPKERQGYEPVEDLVETVKTICKYYLVDGEFEELQKDDTGIVRRLMRAHNHTPESFPQVVEEFNSVLKKAIKDGSVAKALQNTNIVPLPLAERILNQVYARTVSPKVDTLKQYENGTSDVYGELLPRFAQEIFAFTGLKSDQVFLDLGSGVGNVVLQAALQIGCESWGIEQMPNPASLARQQQTEFEARCKRWSITHGKVKLIEGDFLEHPKINDVLKRADVVLINNQAFLPALNESILYKLLDLKEGAKVVSLKSFVPEDWEIKSRNQDDPRNIFSVVRKEFWSGYVSWTDNGGSYHIATVDHTAINRFKSQRS